MNAAVHTVVKVGTGRGHRVLGIRRGYDGLFDRDAESLTMSSVEGISRMGGTVLGTARCPRMMQPGGIEAAIRGARRSRRRVRSSSVVTAR